MSEQLRVAQVSYCRAHNIGLDNNKLSLPCHTRDNTEYRIVYTTRVLADCCDSGWPLLKYSFRVTCDQLPSGTDTWNKNWMVLPSNCSVGREWKGCIRLQIYKFERLVKYRDWWIWMLCRKQGGRGVAHLTGLASKCEEPAMQRELITLFQTFWIWPAQWLFLNS